MVGGMVSDGDGGMDNVRSTAVISTKITRSSHLQSEIWI